MSENKKIYNSSAIKKLGNIDKLPKKELIDIIYSLLGNEIELEDYKEELSNIQHNYSIKLSKYKDLYEFAPVGYIILNNLGIIKRSNKTFNDLVKTDQYYVINRPFTKFLASDYQNIFLSRYKAFFKTPEGKVMELKLLDADNKEIFVRLEAAPTPGILSKQDNELMIIVSDITERKTAEKKIREQHEYITTTLNSIGDAVITTDIYGKITGMNPVAENMCGWNESEAFNKPLEEVFVLKSLKTDEIIDSAINKILDLNKSIFDDDVLLVSKNGEQYYISQTISSIKSYNSKILGVVLVFRDITKEVELQNRAAFKAMLLNQIHDMIISTDFNKNITYINETQCRLIGKDREDILGKNLGDFSVMSQYLKIFDEIEYDDTWRGEISITTLNNDTIDLDTRIQKIFDENGNSIGFICVSTNITEKKRNELALKQTEEEKSLILESTRELFIHHYPDLKIKWINRAASDVIGKPKNQIIGKKCNVIWGLNEELCTNCPLVKAKDTGEPFESVIRCFNRIWSVRGYPIKNDDGDIIGITEFRQDITEREKHIEEKKNLELQLTQFQKMESVGRLAGGIAHDFNNMLSPILGYTEIILDDMAKDDPNYDFIEEIRSAAMKSKDLTKQLLTFSRKQDLSLSSIDIRDIVNEMETLLSRTLREDISFNIFAPEIPCYIIADRTKIEQVILNLVINAQDAMEHGGTLSIETDIVELDEEYVKDRPGVEKGTYIMLSVTDTGVGMEENTLKNIYEPFFTTKGKSGTGLGLATVYGIVKQHKGSIWVYSEFGKGTTFKIYLPQTKIIIGNNGLENIEETEFHGDENILLVEDNTQVRKLAENILKKYGYNIIPANDGFDALKKFSTFEGKFDLIITDVVMPVLDGKGLYEKIVKLQPDIKVLFMSGYTGKVIEHKGFLDNDANFIQKPFAVGGFLQKVRNILNKKNGD